MGSERTHGKSPEEQGRIVRDGYDKIAEKYNHDREKEICKETQEFIGHLPEGGSVLDVGCGGGVPVLRALIAQGFNTTGIDFSKSMLEVAKRNVPQATLVYGDAIKTDFDENSFDGVISTYAIIHIHKSLHATMYNRMYKWLKPGGVMLVCTAHSEWEEIAEYNGVDMAWSHPAPEASLEMVKKAGFEILFERLVPTNDELPYWILAKKP